MKSKSLEKQAHNMQGHRDKKLNLYTRENKLTALFIPLTCFS